MVKNKKGGSSHKKMARKHVSQGNFRQRKLREPGDGEMFARVTRVNGGNVFEVLCNDKKPRQMIVRKKFRGRNKRDNTIMLGTMVLVGLRDWEILSEKKKPKVDLLEVYGSSQMDELKKLKSLNKDILLDSEKTDNDDGFEIDSSNMFIDDNIKQELDVNINKKLEEVTEDENNNNEMDIDWDDI